MESFDECPACILGTVTRIAAACGAVAPHADAVHAASAAVLQGLDRRLSPAELSHYAFLRAYAGLGTHDPFVAEKARQNQAARELQPRLRAMLDSAEDRLYLALKFSVAGNIIDLGALQSFNMMEGVERALRFEFTINDYAVLRERLRSSREILYILDNAGEIVFDELLLEEIERFAAPRRIRLVVRRRPMLNDVTRLDAESLGLAGKFEVIDSGSDVFGLPLAHASPAFREIFHAADLVIAKGMANYETLDAAPRDVFFILMAKCGPISRHLGVQPKDLILKHHRPRSA